MNLTRRFALLAAGLPFLAPALGSSENYPAALRGADKRSQEPARISEALATHAVDTPSRSIDNATLTATKLRVLDVIGCAFGGVTASGNAALVEVVSKPNGSGEATVIGFGTRGSLADVAMANAIIARSFDFEVMTAVIGHDAIASHHSPTTCMTALALAEHLRCSGAEFLAALAVGDDIAARLLVASGLDFNQGWDGSSVYSALAAVVIAARLRKLTPRQTRDAMGLAVDQLGGTIQNIWDGATDFKLPQGAVARNAILSMELAARGWTGMTDPLFASYAFYRQYTAGCARPEVLTADLGKRFYAEEYFKPYPACMATHPSIDCALSLRSERRLIAEDIASVTLRLPESALKNFCAKPFELGRFPQGSANFSYVFQVANAMLRGRLRLEHYSETNIRDGQLLALIDRTTLAAASSTHGLEIEVRTRDGAVMTRGHGPLADHHPFAKGSTRADIAAKFHEQSAASNLMDRARAAQIEERIQTLEREADMSQFMALLRGAT